VPRVIITDKSRSYGVAKWKILPAWRTASTGISLTVWRTPINPPSSGSDVCRGSSRPDTHSGSSLPMVQLRNTSARDDIGWLPLTTVKKCSPDLTHRQFSAPPHCCIRVIAGGSHAPSRLVIILIHNKVTKSLTHSPYLDIVTHSHKSSKFSALAL
jgi:hypothetical protein